MLGYDRNATNLTTDSNFSAQLNTNLTFMMGLTRQNSFMTTSNLTKKIKFILFLLSNHVHNICMATTPNTQPVTTPALTVSLIREALNPHPNKDMHPAWIPGVWREYGYRDAMLDACFADQSIVYEGTISLYDFRYVVYQVIHQYGCEWTTIEWDEDGVEYLETLVDQLVEENPSVWSDGFSPYR